MIANSWIDPAQMQTEDAVRLRHLRMEYGNRVALNDVNLRIPAGEIFGLLGPNGAGKTTTFRVLATLLQPTEGDVDLVGYKLDTQAREIRSCIAYMPDLAPMPSDLRAIEYLRFFAEAHGMRGKERDLRVAECLESVDLQERAKDICTKLSLGMRQRLALAKSILHKPRLLILDEPASGLDPLARIDLREALRRQVAEGATVILSSHVLAELSDLCTSIGLLQASRLLDAGPMRKVLDHHGHKEMRVVIRAIGRIESVARWLGDAKILRKPARILNDAELDAVIDEEMITEEELFRQLGASRLGVTGMYTVETSIEDVIVNLSRNANGHN